MGRGRVEVRRIENSVSRQVTFSKRRRGLAKKARELAVLCDADVALLVFSDKGRLHDFAAAHASVDEILDRYERYLLSSEAGGVMEEHPEPQENMSYDDIMLRSKIEALQKSERNLKGDQLDTLTLTEVQQLQQQIEIALRNIRSRKDTILLNSILELQNKEKMLTGQNSTPKKEMAGLASGSSQHKDRTVSSTKAALLPNLNTCCSTDGCDDLGPVMPPSEVASGNDLPWWMLQPWSAED